MYMDFAEQLEKLNASYSKSLVGLGDEYYTEVVKPFCEKYDLEFLSGNNEYFFTEMPSNPQRGSSFYIHTFQELLDLPPIEELRTFEDSELDPVEKQIVNHPDMIVDIEPIFKVLDLSTCDGPFGLYV